MTTQYTMVMRCEVLWRDFFGRLFAEHTLVVKSAGQPDPFGLLIVLKELRTVSVVFVVKSAVDLEQKSCTF